MSIWRRIRHSYECWLCTVLAPVRRKAYRLGYNDAIAAMREAMRERRAESKNNEDS